MEEMVRERALGHAGRDRSEALAAHRDRAAGLALGVGGRGAGLARGREREGDHRVLQIAVRVAHRRTRLSVHPAFYMHLTLLVFSSNRSHHIVASFAALKLHVQRVFTRPGINWCDAEWTLIFRAVGRPHKAAILSLCSDLDMRLAPSPSSLISK